MQVLVRRRLTDFAHVRECVAFYDAASHYMLPIRHLRYRFSVKYTEKHN